MKRLWKHLLTLCNALVVVCILFSSSLAASTYEWPTTVHTMTQDFATHRNKAIDIAAPYGTTVTASREGTVYRAFTGCQNQCGKSKGTCQSRNLCSPTNGYSKANPTSGYCNSGFGNGVIIQHSDGTYAHYGHMATVSVKNGQWVGQGTIIGTSGDFGYCTGSCLHFELRGAHSDAYHGNVINPETVLGKEPCTSHVKGIKMFCEALHPHYNYFACTNCGQKFTDGTTDTMQSCAYCNGNSNAPATNPPTNTTPSNLTYSVSGASNVTETGAKLSATCSYTGTKPSEVGIYLGTSEGSMQKTKKDTRIASKKPLDVWYNVTGLTAGQTYYYRFYAIVNGNEITSGTQTFATTSDVSVSSVSFNAITENNITESTARVSASCSYKGTRPSEVGLYLGTSSDNMNFYKNDAINHKKNPFDVWYNLSGLEAGKTYYYYFYAKVGEGTTISTTQYFTTAGNPSVQEPPSSQTDSSSSQTTKGSISISSQRKLDVTQTTAQVKAKFTYTGNRPTEIGVYYGKSLGTMTRKTKWGAVDHDRNPFEVTVDLSGLEPGTQYFYQFYGIQDGVRSYRNGPSSFITTSASSSSSSTANTPSNPEPSKPESTANTRTGYVANTNGEYLAINDGPAASPTKSNQIGRIPPGGAVTIYPDRTSGNWYWVEYNGVSGYVYKKFISSSRPNENTAASTPAPSVNTRIGIVSNTNGEYLAINDGPAASPSKSNQIGRIPPRGAVTVYPDRTSGNWYWVEYNGVSGYVYKKFITLQ